MPRGFLKDVGGIKRMRMVKPGYNADDYGLPYNLVVFDSVFPSNLVPITSGVARINNAASDGKFVSWADPGYVPMVTIHGTGSGNQYWYNAVPITSVNGRPLVWVRRDGLYVWTGDFNLPVDIEYIVYRVPA